MLMIAFQDRKRFQCVICRILYIYIYLHKKYLSTTLRKIDSKYVELVNTMARFNHRYVVLDGILASKTSW